MALRLIIEYQLVPIAPGFVPFAELYLTHYSSSELNLETVIILMMKCLGSASFCRKVQTEPKVRHTGSVTALQDNLYCIYPEIQTIGTNSISIFYLQIKQLCF